MSEWKYTIEVWDSDSKFDHYDVEWMQTHWNIVSGMGFPNDTEHSLAIF